MHDRVRCSRSGTAGARSCQLGEGRWSPIYIHPAIFDAYLDGSMLETIAQRARKVSRAVDRLTEMERSMLSLLRRRLSPARRRRTEVTAA